MPGAPLNIAVIGLGWWGRILVPLAKTSSKLRVVRVADPAPAARAQRRTEVMTPVRVLFWLLSFAAWVAPLHADAQPSNMPRIGFLQAYPAAGDLRRPAFMKRLRELGHTEGKTVAIEYLSAEGHYEKLPALAAELVRRKVDLIVADGGTPATLAAIKATRTIPIVFCCVTNPIEQGMVASLARPGGNVTGVTNQNSEFAPKSLELLRELFPSSRRFAVLTNTSNQSLKLVLEDIRAAANSLHLELAVADARRAEDLERAFDEIARARPAAVLVIQDPMLTANAAKVATLAAEHGLSASGGNNIVAERGGLLSYGPDLLDLVRRAAVMTDKILKGAKPADLPVEQPTKFDLVINLRTAKSLGVKIPPSMLARADRVIE